jgi:ribosomal protein S18 acetylase RimI-like enzyme
MLRTFRRGDIPAYYALMTREFPEEAEVFGWHEEAFLRIVGKFQRPWYRFVLGVLAAVGSPVFRFFVLEVDGAFAASAIESFGPDLSYVSSVVVAPPFRRRGYAKRILAACHDAAAKRRSRYVALDVLDTKTGAAALYDSLGYRPVSHASHLVRRTVGDVGFAPSDRAVRPFDRNDGEPLAGIARSFVPPARQEVQPVSAAQFHVPGAVVQALDSRTMAWVVDRGTGPLAWVRASVSPVMDAGHFTAPVIRADATPSDVAALLGTALAWSKSNGATRVVAEVLDENVRAAAGLRAAGFEVAYGSRTLARPTGVR